jgi:hypothetical protein
LALFLALAQKLQNAKASRQGGMERERDREREEEGTGGTSVWTLRRSGFLRSLAIVAEGYGLILIRASASAKQ